MFKTGRCLGALGWVDIMLHGCGVSSAAPVRPSQLGSPMGQTQLTGRAE